MKDGCNFLSKNTKKLSLIIGGVYYSPSNLKIMAFKPSRSSGVMLDRYKSKAEKARKNVQDIIDSYDVLPFDKINEFSKNVYLFWLNDNKFSSLLTGNGDGLNNYYISDYHLRILKRNIDRVYKPFQEIVLAHSIK